MNKYFTEQSIAICAAFIALAALFLSVYEGCATRKHNRLMVAPRLTIYFHFNESSAGWRLSSNGLGPAEVSWLSVSVDGEPKDSWTSVESSLGIKDDVTGNMIFTCLGSGMFYDPNTDIMIYGYQNSKNKDVLMDNWKRVKTSVCYCSAYEECWIEQDDGNQRKVDNCKDHKPDKFLKGNCVLPELE